MLILLTNDDGVYAPGIAALERELQKLGDVVLVAPATEQSGVGHSITFLSPLVCKEVFDGERRRGWAVEGSPADCVKLGIFEFCSRRPDLVVSGINGGLNAGINVLYSGTVAAAIEGAFFGIPSVAVSLEYDEHARFTEAAGLARQLLEQIIEQQKHAARRNPTESSKTHLYNINMPTKALAGLPEVRPLGVKLVPMGVERYGEHYIKRTDPRGRTYYWATNEPPPKATDHETDLSALAKGFITVTPLQFDMTRHDKLVAMNDWELKLN